MSQAWIVTRSDHTQRVFPTDITRNISLLRCVKAEINVIPNVTRDLCAEIITCRAAVIQREDVAMHLSTTFACEKVRTFQQERKESVFRFFYNTNTTFLFNLHARECSQRWTTTNISPEFHSTSARRT